MTPTTTATTTTTKTPPGDEHPDYEHPDADFLATSVACGAWHTLVLTAAGKVFAFGDGFTGQLGLSDRGGEAESRALQPRVVRIERNAGGGGGSPGDVRITEVCVSVVGGVIGGSGSGSGSNRREEKGRRG